MSETVPEFGEKTADLLHVRLAGSRGSVMHIAWAPFSSDLTLGADTHHDFQPACAVGVMRAVSTPWQGATRRIGNSLLGVQNPSIPSLLTLGR